MGKNKVVVKSKKGKSGTSCATKGCYSGESKKMNFDAKYEARSGSNKPRG